LHLGEQLHLSGWGIVFPFLLTALLKTAQGSSTVAIITAASIVAPLLSNLGMADGDGPLFAVLAMGAGSMMISHANDAYFWVIAKFSGLDTKAMLGTYTMASICMGLSAFVIIGALWWLKQVIH
ncbi:MAG TPA: GntP family permease, partial [Flavihumibacter sp.]|nr:GntP family permease [Flavihumibacter sp.]